MKNNNNLMETFYLETPSLERKNEIIDYINEFVEYKSDINGTGSLDKILDGYTFEQALERCLNMQYEEYAKKLGRCQGKTFLLIRKNDNKIIGTINIRWNLTEEMKQFGGHIGYGIRPTERRKGYNKINLYRALEVCEEHGIEEVILDCNKDNLGSSRTMIDLGGVKQEERMHEDVVVERYAINVSESVEKYKDVYGVKNNNQK